MFACKVSLFLRKDSLFLPVFSFVPYFVVLLKSDCQPRRRIMYEKDYKKHSSCSDGHRVRLKKIPFFKKVPVLLSSIVLVVMGVGVIAMKDAFLFLHGVAYIFFAVLVLFLYTKRDREYLIIGRDGVDFYDSGKFWSVGVRQHLSWDEIRFITIYPSQELFSRVYNVVIHDTRAGYKAYGFCLHKSEEPEMIAELLKKYYSGKISFDLDKGASKGRERY